MSAEQWDGVLDVNLAAALRVNAAVEPLLHDGGRVVCLSSVAPGAHGITGGTLRICGGAFVGA
jgi:NAD(P)-dependent dehydrogenase (short-subunit alcohol dehydrogenase family)